MTGTPFIGLSPFQCIALVVVFLTLLILADAFAGHYRSGFVFRSQYAFAPALFTGFAAVGLIAVYFL